MSNPNDPGPRLAAWRAARKDLDPKATLQSCADEVGVKHPTWLDWENGNRSPGLEKALAIELFTNGAIKVEDWGFDVKVFETIRSVIARRDDADEAAPALDPLVACALTRAARAAGEVIASAAHLQPQPRRGA